MLRVVVVGLGAIGFACARAVRAEKNLNLVGLVDADPEKVGKTLFDLGWSPQAGSLQAPENEHPGPAIVDNVDAVVARGADVAIVATSSRFEPVAPTISQLLEAQVAVVSSCEELTWPWYRHRHLAGQIDEEAKAAGRAVLGVGVNPGFVMDFLPVVLSSVVRRINSVRCVRRVDAALRRPALQAKIGATLPPHEFERQVRANRIGHVGLAESLAFLAAGLGYEVAPGSVEETIEPVLAPAPVQSAVGLVRPGDVAGIHQVARWKAGDLALDLDLTMAVGMEDPKDAICIDGPVQLYLKIPGSVPGDSATVATLLNHMIAVHQAPPGLHSMLSLPVAGCCNRFAPDPEIVAE